MSCAEAKALSSPFVEVLAAANRSDEQVLRLPCVPPQTAGKVLVLGLGNDLLCDDAIGLNIIYELSRCLAGHQLIDLQATCEMGLSLLDFIVGYRQLILVDAVRTQSAPPGFLHEIGLDDLKVLPVMSPHFLGIGEIIALGKQLGLIMPEQVKVLAVEAEDPFTVTTQMTAALTAALPSLTTRVAQVALELANSTDNLAVQ